MVNPLPDDKMFAFGQYTGIGPPVHLCVCLLACLCTKYGKLPVQFYCCCIETLRIYWSCIEVVKNRFFNNVLLIVQGLSLLEFNFFLNLYHITFFFEWTKFKAFADDKLNVAKIMISVFDRVENIVGKGENAGYQYFLLLPQCF